MALRYTVYTIVKREQKDDSWLNIGVAFPHDDGKGFNVFLQALPLGDGKIVLREADAKAGEGDDDRRNLWNKPRPPTNWPFLFRNSVLYWRPKSAVETGRFSWYKKACR
jgi:hypothetical protein